MEITNDSLLLTPLWKVNVKGTLLAKVNMVIRIQPAVPLNYSQSDVIHLWICPYLGWRWWRDFHCRMSFRTMPCLIRGTELRAFVFDLQVVKHGNKTLVSLMLISGKCKGILWHLRLSHWLMARGGGPMLWLWWGNLYSSARKQWQFILLQCVSRDTSACRLLHTMKNLAQ